MFHSLLMRAAAAIIWVPAVYLTYFLVEDFTAGQSPVITGLAMIALLVSSVSLLIALYLFRRGDRIGGASSLVMYLLGAVVMGFLELGFWSSSISTGHATMMRADAAREGMEMLAEQDRSALRLGKIAESSGEIRAKMDAQLAQPIGNQPLSKITSNCTDKQAAAFRLCTEYLVLQAAFAKAETIERVEKRIWTAGTTIETGGLKKDIFAGATAASSAVGGSPESWATALSVAMVLLLMATRDLSLLGVFGPAHARLAPKAAAASVSGPPAAEWTHGSIKVAPAPEAATEAPAPVKPRPTTPPGTRKTMKPAEAADDARDNVVHISERSELMMPEFASKFFEESAPPAKTKRKYDMRKRKSMGAAKDWIAERTERSRQPGIACLADEAWNDYYSWCEDGGKTPLPRSKIDRVLQARFGSIILRDGLRDGRGYVGLLLTDDESERRAVA